MTVRIQAKLVNITFIQAYAPTNDADAQQTQAFYQLLSKTQKSAKSGDMVITMGDFNAKIPREHDNERGHVSMYGQGERSDNGDALVEFAVAHDLRMMNTFYKQHPRRLFTWTHPNGYSKNQIDFILVPNRWKSSITNVKTLPGADCGTDHELASAKITIKLNLMMMMIESISNFASDSTVIFLTVGVNNL